jgi:hypothetical protein
MRIVGAGYFLALLAIRSAFKTFNIEMNRVSAKETAEQIDSINNLK